MKRPDFEYPPGLISGPQPPRHPPPTVAAVLWFLAGSATTLAVLAVAGALR